MQPLHCKGYDVRHKGTRILFLERYPTVHSKCYKQYISINAKVLAGARWLSGRTLQHTKGCLTRGNVYLTWFAWSNNSNKHWNSFFSCFLPNECLNFWVHMASREWKTDFINQCDVILRYKGCMRLKSTCSVVKWRPFNNQTTNFIWQIWGMFDEKYTGRTVIPMRVHYYLIISLNVQSVKRKFVPHKVRWLMLGGYKPPHATGASFQSWLQRHCGGFPPLLWSKPRAYAEKSDLMFEPSQLELSLAGTPV